MTGKKGEKDNLDEKKISNINLDSNTNPDINPDANLDSEELKKKQNKQIVWAIVLMAAMIIIILAVPVFVNNYINKFDYKGLEFTKSKLGQIDLYSSNIPVVDTSNGITGKNILSEYSFYIRNDPRKLEDVELALDINNITFYKGRPVYVSYNSSDPRCEYNAISAVGLGRFLINFGSLDVKGAFINEDYATAAKVPYVTCENTPLNTVILVVNGNENKISRVKEGCYELQYKECDILKVTEKFILAVAEGYLNSVYSGEKG